MTSAEKSRKLHRKSIRKNVLLLANAGVPALLREHFDLQIPVWHRHTQVLVMPAREEALCHHLIGHAHRRIAMKTLPQNRLQISGGWRGRWDEQQQRCLPLSTEVEGNLEAARSIIPAIENQQPETIDLSRADTECYDKIPLIDLVPGTENLLFATGWTGHGWTIAPAVASLLAQWVTDDRQPLLLKPFALSRFHAG